MKTLAVQGTRVVVLATGDTPHAVNDARGHLFERFMGNVLERYGYERPKLENFNVTSDGIELDISVYHSLNGRRALAECKACTSPVPARELRQ